MGGFVLWQIKSRSRHAQRPRNHLCKPDMTQHDCLGNNCRHFEKYEDAGYSFLKSLLSVMLVILPNSDLFHYSKTAPKTQCSHPERSGRLRSVHSINVCRPSAASTPPAPLSSLRSAPSASPRIPRAYAHTHSARAFCRRSMSGSIVHGLSKGQIYLFAFKIRCSLLDPQQSSLKWPALRSSRQ